MWPSRLHNSAALSETLTNEAFRMELLGPLVGDKDVDVDVVLGGESVEDEECGSPVAAIRFLDVIEWADSADAVSDPDSDSESQFDTASSEWSGSAVSVVVERSALPHDEEVP